MPIEKRDIPASLLDVVESFSAEAQNAALRKAKELGFDLSKGSIPFDETLINLSQNRDVLREAVKAGKIPQLPLKIQNALLSEAKKTSSHLTALANGTDSILQLENAVEELTAGRNLQRILAQFPGAGHYEKTPVGTGRDFREQVRSTRFSLRHCQSRLHQIPLKTPLLWRRF